MKKMEDDAFEGDTGHLDNEIEMVALGNFTGIKVGSIKPQVDLSVFPKAVASSCSYLAAGAYIYR